MFDIGGLELLLIAVVGLLVIGPERLPETLRTLGLWMGRLRRSFMSVKTEIEKEIGMDEVRRQLHNEAVMDEMKRIEREVHGTIHDVNKPPHDPMNNPDTEPAPEIDSEMDENKIHPDFSTTDTPVEPTPTPDAEPEPTPRPRSEAELEAAHARAAKRAAKEARPAKSK
jgi:sec-independent protein translocase protein TatB